MQGIGERVNQCKSRQLVLVREVLAGGCRHLAWDEIIVRRVGGELIHFVRSHN